MIVTKRKSEVGTLDIRIEENEDKHLDAIFGGNGDIYWVYDNLEQLYAEENDGRSTLQTTRAGYLPNSNELINRRQLADSPDGCRSHRTRPFYRRLPSTQRSLCKRTGQFGKRTHGRYSAYHRYKQRSYSLLMDTAKEQTNQ